MELSNQRRVAAEILKCGINRVWIDPDRNEDVAEAITRSDIRSLIKSGAIKAMRKRGVSRARARLVASQKKKGRRRGSGSREGAKHAKITKKQRWTQTIRPLRKMLKELKNEKKIDVRTYRKFYRHAKGGMFKSKAHLETHLKREGLLKK